MWISLILHTMIFHCCLRPGRSGKGTIICSLKGLFTWESDLSIDKSEREMLPLAAISPPARPRAAHPAMRRCMLDMHAHRLHSCNPHEEVIQGVRWASSRRKVFTRTANIASMETHAGALKVSRDHERPNSVSFCSVLARRSSLAFRHALCLADAD